LTAVPAPEPRHGLSASAAIAASGDDLGGARPDSEKWRGPVSTRAELGGTRGIPVGVGGDRGVGDEVEWG
jgi:hypothetical protein